MPTDTQERFTLADAVRVVTNRAVMRRAGSVALVVGPVLTMINQGDAILSGNGIILWKTALTFMVPYCVSSTTSVLVAMDTHRKQAEGASAATIATAAADPGAQALPCPEDILPSLANAVGTFQTISTNAKSVQEVTNGVCSHLENLVQRGALTEDVADDLRNKLSQATQRADQNSQLAQEAGSQLSSTQDLVEAAGNEAKRA